MKNMDLENCPSCIYRVYVKATVDLELNNYTEVIDTLQNIMRKNDISDLRKPLLSAYINTGNFSAVDSLLRKIELTSEKAVWQDLYLFIGNELLLIGDKKNADVYFNKIITTSENKENNAILASALYYKKDYVEAEKVLKKIYELNPKDFSNLSKLAVSLYKNGKQNEAAKVILEMNALDDDFQFGELYYALAQYYAAINDDENSIRNLFKSVAQGKRFKMDTYQNDPHFLSFRDNNQFQNILNFWH
jgi:tetratricopeptide (TPR) repeat protein